MGKEDHVHGGSKLERRLSRDHGTHAGKSEHGAHKQSAHHPHGRRMSVIGKDGRKLDVFMGLFHEVGYIILLWRDGVSVGLFHVSFIIWRWCFNEVVFMVLPCQWFIPWDYKLIVLWIYSHGVSMGLWALSSMNLWPRFSMGLFHGIMGIILSMWPWFSMGLFHGILDF